MSAVLAPPLSPFKGLAAFGDSELDALFFFGRERERAVLVANLVGAKLTLLYGESGVGKSSLLAAGVMRELRVQSYDAAVVLHDVWSAPTAGLLDAVREAPEAYVILDQFEEYFLYDADGAEDLLPALMAEPHVQVLVSLREDALAQLDVFKARVPFVFANQVRLEHLDRTAARAAVLGPIERWNELTGEEVSVEPSLVDAVLDDVRVEGRGDDRIEAPYLQLVLEQIWERERDAGSTVLRLATLEALGGAASIVRGHLRGALATLSPPEQDVAAEMFAHLITPSGTKIAHNAADLADYADVPPDLLRRILATLTRDRVVHSVDGSDRYEIFHDVLVEPIQSWRLQRRLEHERRVAARRQRRLAAIAVATAIALAIVALVALFALAQRGRARDEARNARQEATQSHARELAANSLAKLGNDPLRSVALALAAARLERSEHIADVLRTALDSSHLDLIIPTHGAATEAALSPDARRVLTGDATGHAAVYAVATARRLASFRVPGRVFTASFAPDGTRLLVAGGGRVIVAGAGKGLVLAHRGVRDAVFGAGGTEIASGGTDGAVRVWNAADGSLLRTFQPGGVVRHVALSPRGDRLAVSWTGGNFDHVSLYSTGGGLVANLRGTVLAFSPTGSLLATGDRDRIARVYDASSGGLVGRIGHGGPVTDVGFSPDGQRVVTASADGAARVFDLKRQQRVLLMPTGSTSVTSASYSPDGRLIVTGGGDGVVRVWNSLNGRQLLPLTGHRDVVSTTSASAYGRIVVSASNDGTVRVWDTGLEDQLRVVGRTHGPVLRVAFVGGRAFAAAKGGLYLWRLAGGPAISLRSTRPLADGAVAGPRLAALRRDGAVLLRPPGGGAALRVPPPASRIVFDRRGLRLLAAGGSSVLLADLASGRRVAMHVPGRIRDAAFARNGAFAVATTRGRVVLFSPGGRQTHVLAAGPSAQVAVAFSPNAALVASGGRDGVAWIWSARTGRLQHRLKPAGSALADVEFSPDGRLFATSALGGDARLWATSDWTLAKLLNKHKGRVAQLAFSPNSQWVLTAGPTAVGLWQVSTGNLLRYLYGHTGQVEAVAFSADGHRILTGSDDQTVRLYDCDACGDVYALARIAHDRLVRVAALLTPRERRRYLGG